MVRQLSPAGELAKLASSRESRTQQAVAEGREQERKELLSGTMNRKIAERRAREDEATGIDSDFTIIEGLRTGKIITIDDLVGRMNRGQSSPELSRNISDTYGIERGPRQYTVELREGLNIGAGQPPRPQGYPPSSQQQYSQKVLPQSYSEDSADFYAGYSEPEQRGQIKVREPKQIKSKGAKGFFIESGKAESASQAAEFEFFNKGKTQIGGKETVDPEGYDFSDLRFGTSSGRAEDVAKLKSGKEAFEYLGIPYSEQPNKDKPQRSKSQTQPYFAGMYANPNFDVDAKKKGVQAYDGINDYTPPVRGKEDRSAQYSSADFIKQGGILQEPLSPEKKAYYSQPRESRGPNPFKTESQFQAFFSESFKPARDQKTKEMEQRITEFSQPQSGGPNIKVRESQQFTGSPKIQELKARAKGQQGTSEDIPFVETRGLPSSYTYLGTTFGTPTEAIRAKEEANRLKRLQAEERRLADESRTDIGKGGKINVSGLLPKEKIDASPQLSEQFDAVIPDPNVVFSGLGSTQRSSPIPRRGKQYTVEKPSEEIGYGNLGSFGFGTIEPAPVKQAKPKESEKQSGIPVSDVYGKPKGEFKVPFFSDLGKAIQTDLGAVSQKIPSSPKEKQNIFGEIGLAATDIGGNIYSGFANLPLSIGQLVQPERSQELERMKMPIVETSGTIGAEQFGKETEVNAKWALGQISDSQRAAELENISKLSNQRREKLYEESPTRAKAGEVFSTIEYTGDIVSGKAIVKSAPTIAKGLKIVTEPAFIKSIPTSFEKGIREFGDVFAGQTRKDTIITSGKPTNYPEGTNQYVIQLSEKMKKGYAPKPEEIEKASKLTREALKKNKLEQYADIQPSYSPEAKLKAEINLLEKARDIKNREMAEFGEFMQEKSRRPEGVEFDVALDKLAKFSKNKDLVDYSRKQKLGILETKEKLRAREIMKKEEDSLSNQFKEYAFKTRPKKETNDIFGDFDEKANPQGSLNWERLFTRKPEGKGAKQVSIGEQQGNIAKGTPESVGKITLGGSKFINKKTGAVIAGVTGTGVLLGNEFFNNQNKPKGRNKDRDDLALFPYLTQPQGQIPFQEQPQKQKEQQKPRQQTINILAFGQELESGQRQSQRQRYRLNVPQMPEEIPFFQQPQLPAEKFAYDEPPINIAPTGFAPWLLRGGGGGEFGGDDTDKGWKFFRVFDVAKMPFGKIKSSVGYYEDSLVPNFEIQRKSKNPLALAQPKAIQEEFPLIEDLFDQKPKSKQRKKKQ